MVLCSLEFDGFIRVLESLLLFVRTLGLSLIFSLWLTGRLLSIGGRRVRSDTLVPGFILSKILKVELISLINRPILLFLFQLNFRLTFRPFVLLLI